LYVVYRTIEYVLCCRLQQQNQLRERCFNISHKLSAMMFGQDRFHRQYWVFPKCGGIYVEGLESGDPDLSDPDAPLLEIASGHFLISNLNGSDVTKVEPTDASIVADEKPSAVSDKRATSGLCGEQLNGGDEVKTVESCKSDLVKLNNDNEVSCDVEIKFTPVTRDVTVESEVNARNYHNMTNVVNGFIPPIKIEDGSRDSCLVSRNNSTSDELRQNDSFLDKSKDVLCKIGIEDNLSKPLFALESNSVDQLQSSFSEGVPRSFSFDATSTPCNSRVVSTSSFTPSSSVVFHTAPSNASLSYLATPMSDMGTPRSLVDISSAVGTPLSFPSRTSTPSMSSSNAAIAESFRLAMLSAAGSMQLPLEFQQIPAPNIPSVPLGA